MEGTSTIPVSEDATPSVMEQVRQLVNSDFSQAIEKKIQEFSRFRTATKEEIFGELCFCILTANTSAEMGIKTQNIIGLDNFIHMDQPTLRDSLKNARYRFYNLRSKFIAESRWIIDELPSLVNSGNTFETREYLVENIKGMGYKESSHFLRNVGVFDFAILDKHIVRMLKREIPETEVRVASRRNYLKTEESVLRIASEMGLKPGILDLYMWKIATGKLIK